MVGKDIHKVSKPIVAEMGGIGILFGFTIGMFIGIYAYPSLQYELIITLLVILLVGIVGMVDDLVMLSSRGKVTITIFSGLAIDMGCPTGSRDFIFHSNAYFCFYCF